MGTRLSNRIPNYPRPDQPVSGQEPQRPRLEGYRTPPDYVAESIKLAPHRMGIVDGCGLVGRTRNLAPYPSRLLVHGELFCHFYVPVPMPALNKAVCGASSDEPRVQFSVGQIFQIAKTIRKPEQPAASIHLFTQYFIVSHQLRLLLPSVHDFAGRHLRTHRETPSPCQTQTFRPL